MAGVPPAGSSTHVVLLAVAAKYTCDGLGSGNRGYTGRILREWKESQFVKTISKSGD